MDTHEPPPPSLKEEALRIVGAALEVLSDLRITQHRVGGILNYKHSALEGERILL